MLKYRIRPAELDDLARCVEIDASYITTYVWQVEEGFEELAEPDEDEAATSRPRIVGKNGPNLPPAFRLDLKPSRLPRPLAVPSPMNDQELLAEWKKTDHLLVAETVEPEALPAPRLSEPSTGEMTLPAPTNEGAYQPDILGYIGLRLDGPRHLAWITTSAVQIDYRRQGVGSRLLTEARQWADRYRLRSLLVELQTKNYPAISFYQQNGFFFCGYNSAYYPTRDMALFFGKRLERFGL